MSLKAPKDCKEGVFQYCNYGYDKNKYTSSSDCMNKKMKEDCSPGIYSQVVGSFILKSDFINGVIPNSNGKPNLLFKKGDKVSGTIIDKFIFNKQTKGILAFPTVKGSYLESNTTNKVDSRVFIPVDYLMEIKESENKKENQKPEDRDVLEGGLLTILFPGGGGANYRLFIRFILLVVVVYLIFKYAIPYIKNNFLNKGA